MKEIVQKLIAENTGISTKKICALIAFALIVLCVLTNLFLGLTVAPYLVDILFYVFASGIGLASLESIFHPSRNISKHTAKIEVEKTVESKE